MSLNDFKINNITATNLYNEGITISEISSKKTIQKISEPSNKKTIVIVLNTTTNTEYTNWLEKVLAFCKLNLDDAHIISYSSDINIENLENQFNPSYIWLFGVSSSALGMKSIKTTHFEISNYNNLTCLPLPRIETFFETQIMQDHKRALMYALKKIFQIQ